ncbi:type IV secretion protein Rhs [Neisseria sp.]|uniref:type IV secretion protein Rhs n=1 Tax=Neisseria sp. TaxID=192066 RepID=UPI00359FAC72
MAEKRWRRLTEAEIEMARKVFSDGIDYARVKIWCGIPFLPFVKAAVSPNGWIFFPKASFCDDFSCQDPSYQSWLIHELTHVWQYQQGFKTWFGGLVLSCQGGYIQRRAYHYPKPEEIRSFGSLNMEQQADVVAHYFGERFLSAKPQPQRLAEFERILSVFSYHPHNRNLLPSYWKRIGKAVKTER